MQFIYLLTLMLLPCIGFANTSSPDITTNPDPMVFLWLVIFILISRSFSIVKKFGLPLVVGEIIAGVILGDLHLIGVNIANIQNAQDNSIIKFMAELGAIILMFEIGIESKFSDLKYHFRPAILVALSGTAFTFLGGFLVSYFLITNSTLQLNLLMGTICAATATGISAKTFKDMKLIRTKEVQLVLVASIIDELLSIIGFAVISAMIIEHSINLHSLSISMLQVGGFFFFAFVFGRWITPVFTLWSTKIHAGINMKLGVLLIICLFFAWLSGILGLATFVGSFIAGLMLEQVYFKSFSISPFIRQLRTMSSKIEDPKLKYHMNHVIDKHEERTLEELLKPISYLFVPVFFIYIGMLLDIEQLFKWQTLLMVAVLLTVSFIGRILSGHMTDGKDLNKSIIGLGMTPIGEAGLIFATFGKNLGIVSDQVFTAIISTLVVASILTPILIKINVDKRGVNYIENE